MFLPGCRPTDDGITIIAEAYFGIPEDIQEEALTHLDNTLTAYLQEFV